MITLDELRDSGRATVTMQEAAQLLGVDARTVSGAVRAGEIPAIRVGRRVLIPRHRFIAYLDGADTAGPAVSDAPAPIPLRNPTDELRTRLLAVLLDVPESGATA